MNAYLYYHTIENCQLAAACSCPRYHPGSSAGIRTRRSPWQQFIEGEGWWAVLTAPPTTFRREKGWVAPTSSV